ncbi:neutral/alkaline non-lysosomal ceramidase N-terminal domain-containing protein [Sphingobacterium lactis]|uniref:Neutral/alkaline non-lysosomal ceramidase, N-terminal n=1 Tax=Sphingobacterium lactis TaxID=797291 RepID=A0A1H5VN63_9SPHI|nr:neutral/alkaline non-lysosomal ceramidase N-terminal domain-containing protein [Sphingobacterium lactis]SEF88762.1 Neutral/alkaline non-lysosomal ceramidase, N-terminal [Sphingobacterium lactis]
MMEGYIVLRQKYKNQTILKMSKKIIWVGIISIMLGSLIYIFKTKKSEGINPIQTTESTNTPIVKNDTPNNLLQNNSNQTPSKEPVSSKSSAKQAVFQAGIGAVDITLPYNRSAKKDSKTATSQKIHDKLYAKALVLDDGSTKIAMIVADNQGIPGWIIDEAKTKIERETGIPIENIMISSTHTHSGIYAGSPVNTNKSFDNYQNLLVRKLAESAKSAFNNLKPAQIAWGSFNEPRYVHNRRWYTKTANSNPFGLMDSVTTNPGYTNQKNLIKPAGPTDPEVSFIALKSSDGKPMAIFANYSVHYIGVPSTDISADYYGEFGKVLANKFGVNNLTDFIGIMSNGTSGDINSLDYGAPKESIQHYSKINKVANDLADNLIKKYNSLEFQSWVPLKSVNKKISIKLRGPSTVMRRNMGNAQKRSSKSNNAKEKQQRYYAVRVGAMEKNYPQSPQINLQVFKIGDLAIGAIPFEVFAETGLKIKKLSPFKDYFTIGLANGQWGYLPTPNQYKKGGYETWLTVSRFNENTSEIISENIINSLNSLK